MFGKFVLNLIFLFSLNVFGAQLGTVVVSETYIYLKADFDANVIATAKRGDRFQMANKPVGPFYKVKMKNNQFGWISSVDIKAGAVNTLSEIKKEKAEVERPLESYTSEKRVQNTFAILRYQGLFVQNLDWKEKTLGQTRKDNLSFWGWNWTGFDTLVEGPFYFDSRIMATFQVPDYYQKITSAPASGWILKGQISFVSANPLGQNFLFHYGMGIASTFSHFESRVIEAGNEKKFTLEDLTIGLVIPIGLSYRLGPISTQIFYQYYWEKISTSGISIGLNWPY